MDIYDAYQLGEALFALKTYSYLAAVADEIKDRLKEDRQLLVRTKSSDQTLAKFDQYSSCVSSLPLSQPMDAWPDQAKTKWRTNLCGWSSLFDSLYREYPDDAPVSYFFSLGYEGLRFAWYIPKCVNEDQKDISEMLNEIQWGVEDAIWIRDHDFGKSLTPEVLNAVKTIADIKLKLIPDPLNEGVTKDDISQMADSAKVIREASKARKLIQ